MLYFIFFLIFVSALLDRYVYLRELRYWRRITQIIYFSCTTIVCVSLALVCLFQWIPVSELLWLMLAFITQGIAKFVYFLISVWGYLMPRYNNRNGVFDRLAQLGVCVVILVLAWGTFYVRNTPRVVELELQSSRVSEAFDGFKIAFFTDLHVGSLPENNKLIAKLVSRLNAAQVDVVLFGGDLVNVLPEEIDDSKADLLSKIASKEGLYWVLGNHDLGIYSKEKSVEGLDSIVMRMRSRQQSMGWQLLENQTTYFKRGEDSISLSGITFPSMGKNSAHARQTVVCDIEATYNGVPKDIFNINLSHTPEIWPMLAGLDSRADLTLSGHVHAMQSKLTIGKIMISPASLLYRFVSGIYLSGHDITAEDLALAKEQAAIVNLDSSLIDESNLLVDQNDKMLYINDGFGYVLLPTRIGCAPEVTIITLKK